MLDFRVSTFLKVCQTLNYTRAAQELHITQPAVSQHIHFLEQHYGVRLFGYENKKLTLTPEGEILRKRLLLLQNDEERMVRELKSQPEGHFSVSIGVTMTVGEYAIARPLGVLLKRHPDWSIHVHFGNTEHLLALLEDGTIDFGLVEGYYPQDHYEHRTFSHEEFIAACAAGHKFRKEPVLTMKDLTGERIIVREPGSGTREILERNLAVKGLQVSDFRSSVEVANMHTIIGLLCGDCGISFLYRIAVEEELREGLLREIPLEDFRMVHDFDFIWEKDSIYSERFEAICDELQQARQEAGA